MKEKELFDMVKNVDEDLICEMLEYSPDSAKGEEYEGVLYSVPEKVRKIHYWKYPVTAAALLLVMVGVLFAFNSGSTLPYNKEEQTGGGQESTANADSIDSAAVSYPLELLHCRLCDDGKYQVDEDAVTVTDDYALFRKYFFGTWEGDFRLAASCINRSTMIIDDSMKSFNMTEKNVWYSGLFYKIGDNALAFVCGSIGVASIHWVDMNDPDTMYIAWGSADSYGTIRLRDDNGTAEVIPAVYVLKKSDAPLNQPEENFLSIFKLYDMAKDHGIDFDLLVDMEFRYETADTGYLLQHNDDIQFYPVYLVSENADKLELRTKIGYKGYFGDELEMDIRYTVEKIDGEWIRTFDADDLENILRYDYGIKY